MQKRYWMWVVGSEPVLSSVQDSGIDCQLGEVDGQTQELVFTSASAYNTMWSHLFKFFELKAWPNEKIPDPVTD